jgi:hypothetical protein
MFMILQIFPYQNHTLTKDLLKDFQKQFLCKKCQYGHKMNFLILKSSNPLISEITLYFVEWKALSTVKWLAGFSRTKECLVEHWGDSRAVVRRENLRELFWASASCGSFGNSKEPLLSVSGRMFKKSLQFWSSEYVVPAFTWFWWTALHEDGIMTPLIFINYAASDMLLWQWKTD